MEIPNLEALFSFLTEIFGKVKKSDMPATVKHRELDLLCASEGLAELTIAKLKEKHAELQLKINDYEDLWSSNLWSATSDNKFISNKKFIPDDKLISLIINLETTQRQFNLLLKFNVSNVQKL